jgi:hypothetical protein
MVCRWAHHASKGGIMHIIEAAVAAFAVGVFCPAVARKIKSFFSKEATAVVTDAKAEVKKV